MSSKLTCLFAHIFNTRITQTGQFGQECVTKNDQEAPDHVRVDTHRLAINSGAVTTVDLMREIQNVA